MNKISEFENKNIKFYKKILKDNKGLLYSTELLLSIILLIFIIGIIINISDDLNEKIINDEYLASIEDRTITTADYLINNLGNPENWEKDENLNKGIVSKDIIPGLAIKNKNIENNMFEDESSDSEKVIINTISYEKLIKIKNNYEKLINQNIFNNSLKSSITINPINPKIKPITLGNIDINNIENDVIVVNRFVKCDYYSKFVIYNFNDLELNNFKVNKISSLNKNISTNELCNHDTNTQLENHTDNQKSIWLCKSFKIYSKTLNQYDYFLINDGNIKEGKINWILESLNNTKNNSEMLNQEIINLNPYFENNLINKSENIYSIHFNIPKENINKFKTVLVALPKNLTKEIYNDELKYEYFKVQDVNFILKTTQI